MIDKYGTIYEGMFEPDLQRTGFQISYRGLDNSIFAGWYVKNRRHGNFLHLKGDDLSISKETGWYSDGKFIGPMKED